MSTGWRDTRPNPSNTAPLNTTGRVPILSLAAPQPNPAIPIVRKSMVIALEIPARDHPVSTDIGCKYTASENIAPIPTHVISAPAPTITQRYDKPRSNPPYFKAQLRRKTRAFPNKTNGNPRKIHSRKLFWKGLGFGDRWTSELLTIERSAGFRAGHL